MHKLLLIWFVVVVSVAVVAESGDFVYSYITAEPQKAGWPLTDAERTTWSKSRSMIVGQVARPTNTCLNCGRWFRRRVTLAAMPG